MIVYLNVKISACQLAKEIVADKGTVGADYWFENCSIEHDKLTDREREQIEKHLERQVERVQKFLGIGKIDYYTATCKAQGVSKL